MFISDTVHEALLVAGVQLVDRGDRTVDVHLPAGREATPLEVKVWSRPVGPSVIDRLASVRPASPGLLVVASSLSPGARGAIEDLGWSWIADPRGGPVEGRLMLGPDGHTDLGPRPGTNVASTSARAHRVLPGQRHAIIRHLVLREAWTQAELVEVCASTQPRVSQVLRGLLADGLVVRSHDRGRPGPATWTAANAPRLAEHWMQSYPGPGGAAPTYWLSLETVVQQARAACEHIEKQEPRRVERHLPVVSADAAADLIAPSRHSRLAVVYCDRGADLTGAGFTPAPREHATLQLVVPSDISVWPHPVDDPSMYLAPNAPYQLADPLQVAWDLLDSGTLDADQAAGSVLDSLFTLRERGQ